MTASVTASVSVVVLNYNGSHLLPECLESLLGQDYSPLEVLVVDNNSCDESKKVVERYSQVRWVGLEENNGLGPGYNSGVRVSKGEKVFVVNNDMRFEKNCVAVLAGAFERYDNLFAADPLQWDWSGSRIIHGIQRFRLGWKYLRYGIPFLEPYQDLHQDVEAEVPWGCAGAIMVDRKKFDALKGFDPTFFLDYEDVDLCWRAWLRGWRTVFVPGAQLYHKIGESEDGKQLRNNPTLPKDIKRQVNMRRLYSQSKNAQRFVIKTLPAGIIAACFMIETMKILMNLIRGRFQAAKLKAKALLTNLSELPEILLERDQIGRSRVSSSGELLKRWSGHPLEGSFKSGANDSQMEPLKKIVKILFVIHTPRDERTAVYKIYRDIAERFRKVDGYDVDLITSSDFASLRRSSRAIALIYPVLVMTWLSRQLSYDIIYFHSYSGWVVNGLRKWIPNLRKVRTVTFFQGLEPIYFKELIEESRLAGRPVSLRFRFFYSFLLNRLIRWSVRSSDRVLCCNRSEERFLAERGYQTPENVVLMPNSVHETFFVGPRPPREVKRLLFVAQWQLRKGTRYLVEAFLALAAVFPDLHLDLIGTLTPEKDVLKDFPASLHGRIRVVESLVPDAVPAFYKEADIFVFPSLLEGFSLALLEAMAAGLPVVASTAGAAPDLIVHQVNGLLIPMRDARALEDAVILLIKNKEARERFGEAAAQTARKYLFERNMIQWTDLNDRLTQMPCERVINGG